VIFHLLRVIYAKPASFSTLRAPIRRTFAAYKNARMMRGAMFLRRAPIFRSYRVPISRRANNPDLLSRSISVSLSRRANNPDLSVLRSISVPLSRRANNPDLSVFRSINAPLPQRTIST
jgi:hypothetical protein